MKGQIVQLDPVKTANKAFAGCLMIVTEERTWGVVGYVQSLGTREARGGQAYYRAEKGTYEYTSGHARWMPEEIDEIEARRGRDASE